MAKSNEWLAGAPQGDHPIMSELARFHAGFATLEHCLNMLMAFALGKRQEVAYAILARIRNIADRIEIIRAVADEADHLTEVQRYSVRLACDRALALNARRNVYAHGAYDHCGDKIRVTPFAFSPRKTQKEVLKLNRVRSDVEEIDGLLVATMLFIGAITDAHLAELGISRDESQSQADPKEPRT